MLPETGSEGVSIARGGGQQQGQQPVSAEVRGWRSALTVSVERSKQRWLYLSRMIVALTAPGLSLAVSDVGAGTQSETLCSH